MGTVRIFDSGATRDSDTGKLDYRGFLSPLVLKRFAEYMQQHQVQSDGTLRASDNWKKGIPQDAYLSSELRHMIDVWLILEGYPEHAREGIEDALCAMLFNIQGMLHEILKRKGDV